VDREHQQRRNGLRRGASLRVRRAVQQIATVTPVSTTTYADSPAAGTYWYRLSTYIGNWQSATTTPVSATVSSATSTGAKPCVSGSNAADTGGNGNGYESLPNNACASDGSVATDASTGTGARSAVARTRPTIGIGSGGTRSGCRERSRRRRITVRADVGMNNNGGTSVFCVELSWDGGTTWTTAKSVHAYELGHHDVHARLGD
jgi:hypothetical protein